MDDKFLIKIMTALDEGGIKTDYNKIKQMFEKDPAKINTVMDMSATKTEVSKFIKEYSPQLQKMFSNMGVNTNLKDLESSMKSVFNEVEKTTKNNNKFADSMDVVKTRSGGAINNLNAYTKKLKPQALREYSDQINKISNAFSESAKTGDRAIYSKANASLSAFKSEMKSTGAETATFTQLIKNNIGAFTNWYLIGGAVSSVIGNFKEAIGVIGEVDTQLTEISKTSNLSGDALKQLGIDAFDSASKYGTTVQSYLSGYLEMSRGTDEETAKGLAGLSILAQSAGDMTDELANGYIVATNAAYGYNNEVSKLNAVLDGQNQITNRNQVSMSDLAEATKVAGSQANQSGVAIDQMTAATGTMIATTKQGGEVAGRAYKAILMNLQQVSGETEDGEILNEESFKKAEKALNNVGVKTEELVNGTAKLRDPMQILKELASVYNSLPDNSADKANIINDLGGKHYGNQLSGLLSNWKTYEKMLSDYTNSSGSAAAEAQKTADSLQGRINTFTNTWDRMVANVVDSDVLKTFVSLGTGAVDLADKMNLLQIALIGIGGFTAYKGLTNLVPMITNATSSTIAFGNALNIVKANDFANSSLNLSQVLNGLNQKQITAVLSTKELSSQLSLMSKEQIITTLTNAGLSEVEATTTASTLALSTATGAATTSTLGLGASLKALGAAMMANPIGLAITGITVAISALSFGVNAYKQQQEELLANNKKLAQAYKEEDASLNGQISTYKNLQDKLNEGNLSVSETKSIKEELLSIQNTLSDSYGTEASKLDLVNGKYQEQLGLLSKLSENKARDYVAENKSGYESDKDYLSQKDSYKISGVSGLSTGKKLQEYLKQYKNVQTRAMGNQPGEQFMQGKIEITLDQMSVQDSYKTLTKLYNDIDEKFGKGKDAEALKLSISKVLNTKFDKSKIDEAKARIEEYTKAQIVANDQLRPLYQKSVQAVEEYNNALSSGKGVEEAKGKIDKLKEIVSNSNSIIEGSKGIFQDLFSSIGNASSANGKLASSSNNASNAVKSQKASVEELTKTLNTSRDIIDSLSGILDEVNGKDYTGLSASSLKEITNNYPQLLAYVGDESSLRKQLIKLIDEQKNTSANAYLQMESDSKAFYNTIKSSEQDRIIQANNAINTIISNNGTLVNALGSDYQVDLNNFKSIVNAKARLETELIKNSSKAWSEYYSVQVNAQGKAFVSQANDGWVNDPMDTPEERKKKIKQLAQQGSAASSAAKAYNTAISKLNSISKSVAIKTSVPTAKVSSGTGTKSNKSGSGKGKSSSTPVQKETIDWIQRALDVINQKIERAKKLATDVYSTFKNQNKELDKEIKLLDKQIAIETKSYNKYMQKANSVKISDSLKNKVKNGSMDITQYTSPVADKIKQYQDWYDQAQKVKDTLVDLKLQEKELNATKIANVIDDYGRKTSRQDKLISQREQSMSTKEANGGTASKPDYDYLINRQKTKTKELNGEYKDLEKLMKNVPKYSDKWYEYQETLIDIKVQLDACKQSTNEYLQKINQLKWDSFDKGIKKIDTLLSDTDQLIALSKEGSNEALVLNTYGYDEASKKAKDLSAEIKRLNKEYANKKDNTYYVERLDSLNSELGSAISSMQSYKNALSETAKAIKEKEIDALNKEYDAYKKIIDARKEALEQKKKDKEYNDDTKGKTDNINAVKRRIAELEKAAKSGDRNAAKEKRDLEEELAKLETELSDTQYDHDIELQENALDKALSDYEIANNKKIEAIQALYDHESELIKSVSNLTESQFKLAIDNIKQYASDNFLSIGSDFLKGLNGTSSDVVGTGSSSGGNIGIPKKNIGGNKEDAKKSDIKHILSSASGSGKSGTVNDYVSKKGYKNLSDTELKTLAIALAVSPEKVKSTGKNGMGMTKDSYTTSAVQKKIVAELKKSGFLKGGLVDSLGEDGIAFVKNKELILNQPGAKVYREDLVPLMNNFVNSFSSLPSNLQSVNNTKNTAPVINITIPITGNVDSSLPNRLDASAKNIANITMKELYNVMRKS